MKEMMIAATMAAAANLAYTTTAMAQISQPEQETPAPEAAPPPDVIALPEETATDTLERQGPARESHGIEEVVVTAQRREQSAQDVPISITVFNPEQLANANITSSSDLATYTPSLATNNRFGSDNASFAIRGFTQDLRTTASVGTYFAEVIAPRGQSVQTSGDGAGPGALFDLTNVQVLKGPQGTLFGRNTTGGAVLLVPKKPTDQLEGYVELSGGDFDAFRQQAVVNVPVTEDVKLRFGVDHNKRTGYVDNYTGIGADNLNDTDYSAFRLSGVVNLTETLENYTILSYTDSESHGNTSQLFACNPNVTQSPLSVFTGPGCTSQLSKQAAEGHNGFYDTASTVATPQTVIKEQRLINTTTWNATDDVTLKNILAYAHLFTKNESSVFGTQFTETQAALLNSAGLASLMGINLPVSVADPRREFTAGASLANPNFPVTSQKTWVEELQLQGKSLEGSLQWQTGVYYEHSLPDGYSGNTGASLIDCQLTSLDGPPSGYNCNDPYAGALGSVITYKLKTDYLNQAIYTQASYDILDSLSVTGGLRYTWDRTRGEGTKTRYTFAGTVQQAPIETTADPEAKSRAPTGLLELSYKPVKDVMTYAKYVRGYRQGSVNMAADADPSTGASVQTWSPEHVNTYEIGAKTQFGGIIPGRINAAAFYNDLRDMQLQNGYISQDSGTTTAIINAGRARIAGVELEAFVELIQDLTLGVSYSYLNTKLLQQDDHKQEVIDAAGGSGSINGQLAGATYTPIAVEGESLPFAPDHTVVSSLSYQLPLPTDLGDISVSTTYVYTGKRRSAAATSTIYDQLAPFNLLNLNLNWTDMFKSSFDLAVFGTNVLDEKYATYYGGTYNVLGFESRQTGAPRMIGARLKYNFKF